MLSRRYEPDIGNGETKNECPYHPKDKFQVSINDVCKEHEWLWSFDAAAVATVTDLLVQCW